MARTHHPNHNSGTQQRQTDNTNSRANYCRTRRSVDSTVPQDEDDEETARADMPRPKAWLLEELYTSGAAWSSTAG